MTLAHAPTTIGDPTNAAILAVAEDQLEGFQADPFAVIAERTQLDVETVILRVRSMLAAGTIRRVRQTLMSTNLAAGALVAWRVPPERLTAAFEFMFEQDPFSGHVVLRSTDSATPGAAYKLWTTLKVPQGFSLQRHADYLAERAGADRYRLMPARRLFALGVGHLRRRGMEPGSRADDPAEIRTTELVELSELEWRVLTSLKREFAPAEIQRNIWSVRADEAGVTLDRFCEVAAGLDSRRVIGRFSTFLEHVKPLEDGERVTRYNALFHWAVPAGREIEAGQEVGRHHVMTHAYWREAGPEFNDVNVMGVAHSLEKDVLLEHKRAIDSHLEEAGIPVTYTNVFWGGRSEIKPSEISPIVYEHWCSENGLDPAAMRESAVRP
ncbi:MAG TPA: Lrp/AsnC family transcriptional regulator [Dehalococcoidia bacterium]|nr:Lrp/AsnC family transcriptional regulator [Dehalococcoidia bacterium]